MDKAWFHHCLTGLLGPSAIRRADLDVFAATHPSQANIRFVRAIRALGTGLDDQSEIARDAVCLPDRAALFRQSSYGELWPIPGPHAEFSLKDSPQPYRKRSLPGVSTGSAGKSVPLPVYSPPAPLQEGIPETEDTADDEMGRLEDLLFGDLEAENTGVVAQGDYGESPQSADPSPRAPIMERFDPSLGHKELSAPVGDFLHWLQRMPALPASPDQPEAIAKTADLPSQTHTLEVIRIKEGSDSTRKGDQKKRKKKKEARKLAKSSIRPSQEVASETLAALLARQGHIDQALDMYQRLMLLVPEKKSIFAGQIAKLKRKEP